MEEEFIRWGLKQEFWEYWDKCFEQVVKFVFMNQEQLRLQEEKNEEERSKVGLKYLFYTSTFV